MAGVVVIEPDPFSASAGAGSREHYLAANPGGKIPGMGADYDKDAMGAATVALGTAKGKKGTAWSDNAIALSMAQHPSRPFGGIQVKPNTHAYVQVVSEKGEVIKVFNQLGYPASPVHATGGSISASMAEYGSIMGDKTLSVPERKAKIVALEAKDGAISKMNGMLGDMSDPTAAGLQGTTDKADAPLWNDWLLQSVVEQRVEKTQLIETFGGSYLYAFGQKPRSLSFKGVLLNTEDYNWRAVFWENWDKFFRATKLIEKQARLFIGWDDIMVAGYPISAYCAESADSPNAMQFSFTFLVTDYVNYSASKGFAEARKARLFYSKVGHHRAGEDKLTGSGQLGSFLKQRTYATDKFNILGPQFLQDMTGDLTGWDGQGLTMIAYYAQQLLLNTRSMNWNAWLHGMTMDVSNHVMKGVNSLLQEGMDALGKPKDELDYAARAIRTAGEVIGAAFSGVWSGKSGEGQDWREFYMKSDYNNVLRTAYTLQDLAQGMVGVALDKAFSSDRVYSESGGDPVKAPGENEPQAGAAAVINYAEYRTDVAEAEFETLSDEIGGPAVEAELET